MGRCGSLWDRSGSLWIVVDRCGSLWVVPGFSNYGPGTRLYKTILFVTFSCIYFFARDREGQNQITIRSERARVYSFTFCYVCFALTILSAYYVI